MYVLRYADNTGYVQFAAYGAAVSIEKADRFPSTREALDALQTFVRSRGLLLSTTSTSGGLTIERLTVTPGTTTRREVPLGTVGSKVAIKSGHGSAIYFGTRPLDTLYPEGFQRDIQQALLFTSVSAATAHYVKLARNEACWTTNITLVDILEETTPETLTTTPLE